MKTLRFHPVFIALGLMSSVAFAAPVGTVLFARGDVQIIDAKGKVRLAVRGQPIQAGERVIAPPGTVSQIKLLDGSLFGVRPDTEFKIELPDQAPDKAKQVTAARPGSAPKAELPAQASEKAKQVISLLKGGLRVINLDTLDGKQRELITLKTDTSTIQLRNGDLESFFVRPDAAKTKGAVDGGSYTRLITGSGSVKSGSFEAPLAIRTISFVPKLNVAPTLTTAVAPTMFVTPVFTTSMMTLSPTTTLSTATTTVSPTLSTSTINPTLSTATISPSLTTTLSPTTSTFTSPTLLSSTTLTSSTALTSPTISPTTSTLLTSSTLSTTLNTSSLSTTSLASPTLAVTSPTITYVPPPTTLTTTYIAPITTTYIYVPPPTTLTTTYIAPITTTYVPKTVTCLTCSTYIK